MSGGRIEPKPIAQGQTLNPIKYVEKLNVLIIEQIKAISDRV